MAEPNAVGTSWASMRWKRGGNSVDARTQTAKAAASSQTSPSKTHPFAPSSSSTLTQQNKSATQSGESGASGRRLIGSLRARFGADGDSATTSSRSSATPLLSFTNKVAPATSQQRSDAASSSVASAKIVKSTTRPSATAIASRSTFRVDAASSSGSKNSPATEEYVRAVTQRKQTTPTHNEPSTSTTRPERSVKTNMPEVLSRFGSRNPAFLAGGVVRTVPIAFTSGPRHDPQPSSVLNKPIPKADRPWRQRLADQARLRNLEDDVSSVSYGKTSPFRESPSAMITRHTSPQQPQTSSSRQVVSASTPTSSIALRNYESKFTNRARDPNSSTSSSARPSSLVLPSSSTLLAAATNSRYSTQRNSLTGGGAPTSRNSPSSRDGSNSLSLLSAMPSSASARFRASTAASALNYGSSSVASRYTPGSSSARRLSSNVMSRSYTPSYVPTPPRVTISTTYTNYGNYRNPPPIASVTTYKYDKDEHKRMGEGTSWRTVQNPPPVYERKSRRDRSSSGTRKRRSRSRTNEPPPPGSSSDSDPAEEDRVPPRTRRLRKKPSNPSLAQENTKPVDIGGDTQARMPAAVGDFETSSLSGVKVSASSNADVLAETQNKPIPSTNYASDLMDTSIHSTITNVSDMGLDEGAVAVADETKYNAVTSFKPAGVRQKRRPSSPKTRPVPGIWPSQSANELNISQNKQFKRHPDHIIVEITMKHFPYAKASTAHFRMPRQKRSSIMSMMKPAAPPKPLIESKTISATFMRPKLQSLNTTVTFKNRRPTTWASASLKLREPKPKPLRVTAESSVNRIFTNKRRLRLGVEKTLRIRGKCSEKAHLECKSTSSKGKRIELSIQRKPETRACNGTVRDEKDTVFARVESGICMAPVSVRFTLAQPPKIFSPTQHQYNANNDGFSSPEPYEPQLHVPLRPTDRLQGAPLVLPDRSVLEDYVKRKRNHLESIRNSKPNLSSTENSLAEPTPPPTAQNPTELQAPCSVRILEPHVQQALITTPTRSRLSSAEPISSSTDVAPSGGTGRELSMTPRPNENSGASLAAAPMRNIPIVGVGPAMIAHSGSGGGVPQNAPQQQLNAQQQGALFRGVLRKTSDPTGGARLKPAPIFDTPKSPFEERMQNQAKQVRKASAGSSDTDTDLPSSKNRASIDGGMAQGFAAALAAQQPTRHERYAAHIPVAPAGASGRQSVTSLESTNSGALDTASKQLDQMIDQARYKHQQHRTKFKEAIDYLDQIFEDLKKECEPTSPPAKQEAPQPQNFPRNQQPIQRQQSAGQQQQQPQSKPGFLVPQQADKPVKLRKAISQDAQSSMTVGEKSRTIPAAQQSRLIQQQPVTVRVIQPQPPSHQPQRSADIQRHPIRKQRSNVENGANGDVEVSETIILPSKNTAERLDYTRQWVVDDIRSWIDKPTAKPDRVLGDQQLLRQHSSGADSADEHSLGSLGSCSAEVAAINIRSNVTRRKPSNNPQEGIKKHGGGMTAKTQKPTPPPTTTIIEPKLASGPVKPRAYRPQPNNNATLPIGGGLSAPEHAYEMQKVASQQDIARPPTRESLDRPGSQDYQSLGSTHSQDGYRPNFPSNSLQRSVSGAFVQYPQRGSIQSLPDAVLVAGNAPISGPRMATAGSSTTLQPYPMNNGLHHAPSNTSGYGSTTLGGSSHHLQLPSNADPAVQALIAEHNLQNPNQIPRNGDSSEVIDEKRRSFPTTQNDVAYRKAASVQRQVSAGGARLNVPQQTQNYTGSMDRGIVKMQQQQQQPPIQETRNPFTSKVLGPQKPQPMTRDPNRQQFQDATSLLDSVIDELQPRKLTKQQPQPRPSHNFPTTNIQSSPQQRPGAQTARQMPQAPLSFTSGGRQTSQPSGATPQQLGAMSSGGKSTLPRQTSTSEVPPGNNPFETINAEKLGNPSRVEAMHKMFESRPGATGGQKSRAPLVRRGSKDADPTYSEIAEFQQQQQQQLHDEGQQKQQFDRTPSFKASNRPALPQTQPPSTRSQPTTIQRIPPLIQRQPQPSVDRNTDYSTVTFDNSSGGDLEDDDEEGGFYDNIMRNAPAPDAISARSLPPPALVGARFGQNAPTFARAAPPQPPPHRFPPQQQQQQQGKGAGARIGQLIRKLGGAVAERPVVHSNQHQLGVERIPSSGSVLSLNRIDRDAAPKRGGMLMKSNSLSHEPWRIYAMDKEFSNNNNNGMNSANDSAKSGSFGNRLKQTIFGSKKWLNS